MGRTLMQNKGLLFLATAASVVAIGFPATAEVSADLVFCSRLKDTRERIACYDAAARIAERGAARSTVSGRSGAAPALAPIDSYAANFPLKATPVPPQRGFQGAYGAIGGTYGI